MGFGCSGLSAGRSVGCWVLGVRCSVLDAGSQVLGVGALGFWVLSAQHRGTQHSPSRPKTYDIKAQDPAPRTLHSASSNRHPAPKTLDQALKTNVQPPTSQHPAPSYQHPDPRPNAKPLTPQHPSPSTHHPGLWFLRLASWTLVLGSWFLVLFSWVLGVGCWVLDLRPWVLWRPNLDVMFGPKLECADQLLTSFRHKRKSSLLLY